MTRYHIPIGSDVELGELIDAEGGGGALLPTADEKAALDAANAPDGGNPFATMDDVGGGSQPVKVVAIPIAFDTPNLVLTGIPIYTPAADEQVLERQSYVSVTTAWNGTTPNIHFGVAGTLDDYDSAFGGPFQLTNPDDPVGAGGHASQPIVQAMPGLPMTFLDATPLTAMIDDTNDGDPGSTQGAGVIVLVIVVPQ